MASPKKETRIVQAILAWMKENGGDGYHVHGSSLQRSGEPDIDGNMPCLLGGFMHIKVEVKTPEAGPTPSKLQAHRLAEYKKRGYVTGCVTSVEEFKLIVHKHERKVGC